MTETNPPAAALASIFADALGRTLPVFLVRDLEGWTVEVPSVKLVCATTWNVQLKLSGPGSATATASIKAWDPDGGYLQSFEDSGQLTEYAARQIARAAALDVSDRILRALRQGEDGESADEHVQVTVEHGY